MCDNIPRNERYCLCCNVRDMEIEYNRICICRYHLQLKITSQTLRLCESICINVS